MNFFESHEPNCVSLHSALVLHPCASLHNSLHVTASHTSLNSGILMVFLYSVMVSCVIGCVMLFANSSETLSVN